MNRTISSGLKNLNSRAFSRHNSVLSSNLIKDDYIEELSGQEDNLSQINCPILNSISCQILLNTRIIFLSVIFVMWISPIFTDKTIKTFWQRLFTIDGQIEFMIFSYFLIIVMFNTSISKAGIYLSSLCCTISSLQIVICFIFWKLHSHKLDWSDTFEVVMAFYRYIILSIFPVLDFFSSKSMPSILMSLLIMAIQSIIYCLSISIYKYGIDDDIGKLEQILTFDSPFSNLT